MKGYSNNIEQATLENNNFRKVLYTSKHSQLVLMCLAPNEDIGEEIHENIDQFFRIENGVGKVLIDDNIYDVKDGSAIIVPAGANHNVTNTGSEPLKLYTIYSPPEHIDKTLRSTKKEAMENEEHFDGLTTE